MARVNIKPTTAFCTISQEIPQWISTATGNNGSQLQQPALTHDIPVAGRPPALWVDGNEHITEAAGSTWCPGSECPSHSLEWPLSAQPPGRVGCLGRGSLTPGFLGRAGRQAWRKGKASPEPRGAWEPGGKDIISVSQGVGHLSLKRTEVLLSKWPNALQDVTALKCFSVPGTYLQISLIHWWKVEKPALRDTILLG